jgi:CRP/FNR family transcriptional regulator, cyclic AMP receptor protein
MVSTGTMSSPKTGTVALLRKIQFLARVEDAILERISKGVRKRVYKPNTALFHEGEPGHLLFLVASGWVRIEKITPNNQTLVIARRGPGTQLGEMALFDGSPRMADAVTDTECELLTVDRQIFLDCLTSSPTASLAVMASLAEMVRNAGANLESFRSLDTLGRVAELLLSYCESHGELIGKGAIRITRRITHQSMADQVGVVRETVTRALSVLTTSGAIAKEGSLIIVKRPDKLRQLIEE